MKGFINQTRPSSQTKLLKRFAETELVGVKRPLFGKENAQTIHF